MEITLGSEVVLSLHTDAPLSYTELEKALTDAGFETYAIMRNQNADGTGDSQIYVRGTYDSQSQLIPLPAGETMTKLSEAISALEEGEPPE